MERQPIKDLIEKEEIATLLFLAGCFALALIFTPTVGSSNLAPAMEHAGAPWIFGPIQILLLYFPPWLGAIVYPVIIIAGFFSFPWLVERFGVKFSHSVFITLFSSIFILLVVFFIKEFLW